MSTPPADDPFPFDPVPSRSNRHDGWTPERQRAFILVLGRTGVVAFAARAVGMSARSAYRLLERAGAESSFARAWEDALPTGKNNVRFSAYERAVDGVEVPYFYGGRQRGTQRVYDNRLLAQLLRAAQAAEQRQRRS